MEGASVLSPKEKIREFEKTTKDMTDFEGFTRKLIPEGIVPKLKEIPSDTPLEQQEDELIHWIGEVTYKVLVNRKIQGMDISIERILSAANRMDYAVAEHIIDDRTSENIRRGFMVGLIWADALSDKRLQKIIDNFPQE